MTDITRGKREVAGPKGLAAYLRDSTIRGVLYQLLLIAILIAIGWYLVANTQTNLAARNIATGFDFLDRQAGFAIGESLISYTPEDSYRRAILVGLLNTLLVSVLGIVLCTVIGVFVGISRLSSNWLVARIATVVVEGLRNVPLLLQLFVWYGIVTISLPSPREALNPMPGVFLSNRGIKVPAPIGNETWWAVLAALALAVLGVAALRRYATTRRLATGRAVPVLWPAVALVIGLPLLAAFLVGPGIELTQPALKGFNFSGGVTISPELAALLLGLSVYTSTYVAEIVRGGILAVPSGQTEAARALGLKPNRILRLVILPQALRVIVPPTISQYLNLVKNSSLAVAIGYPDLVSNGDTALNQTGQAIECIAIMMLCYLVISLSVSALLNWYNARIALVER